MMKLLFAMLLAHLLVFGMIVPHAHAQDFKPKRSKVIDFDGEVVEGINKKSLDSLSTVADDQRRKKSHLYRKRKGFRDENARLLGEMRSQ